MPIRVDFPAPFSPRSARISPRRRSRSITSLASVPPGNRLVIPRSSTRAPSGSPATLLLLGGDERHLEGAGLDRGLSLVDRLGGGRRQLRGERRVEGDVEGPLPDAVAD